MADLSNNWLFVLHADFLPHLHVLITFVASLN